MISFSFSTVLSPGKSNAFSSSRNSSNSTDISSSSSLTSGTSISYSSSATLLSPVKLISDGSKWICSRPATTLASSFKFISCSSMLSLLFELSDTGALSERSKSSSPKTSSRLSELSDTGAISSSIFSSSSPVTSFIS